VAVLVLDVDGVVVLGHPEGGRWDKNLLRDIGVAPERLQERFFRPHWHSIATGGADMIQVLNGVWHELESSASPRDLVDYWFSSDSRLNRELLAEVDAWRARGNAAFLGTVQEHHRANYLWKTLGLRNHFDGMHYSAELGAAKPAPAFFERAHARLRVKARNEVVFLDDAISNVEAAADFGWQARHYTNADDLRCALAESR
jgi:putative hydrolase of the HAD superfamily